MSGGLDDINFTFTLYSAGRSGVEIHSSFLREHRQNWGTQNEVNKNILFLENIYEVLERALNSHSAQYSDLIYSGSVLILLEKSNDRVLYSVD